MPTLALRSELIKTRSLRVSFLVLPLAVVFLAGAAVVSLEIARRGDTGAGLTAMVESSAFAFSSGSLLSGLVLGVFGALIVTTDLGSGTINHSLILLPRRDIPDVLRSCHSLMQRGGSLAIAMVEGDHDTRPGMFFDVELTTTAYPTEQLVELVHEAGFAVEAVETHEVTVNENEMENQIFLRATAEAEA